jgi:hypothetical protein
MKGYTVRGLGKKNQTPHCPYSSRIFPNDSIPMYNQPTVPDFYVFSNAYTTMMER